TPNSWQSRNSSQHGQANTRSSGILEKLREELAQCFEYGRHLDLFVSLASRVQHACWLSVLLLTMRQVIIIRRVLDRTAALSPLSSSKPQIEPLTTADTDMMWTVVDYNVISKATPMDFAVDDQLD